MYPIFVTMLAPASPEPHWTAYFTAVGAPLTAIVAAIIAGSIAYRQWDTARRKLQLDMFDRRFAVYKAVADLLDEVYRLRDIRRHDSDKVSTTETLLNQIKKCTEDTATADWVMNKEVAKFIEEVLEFAKTLHMRLEKLREFPESSTVQDRVQAKKTDRDLVHQWRKRLKEQFNAALSVTH